MGSLLNYQDLHKKKGVTKAAGGTEKGGEKVKTEPQPSNLPQKIID